MRRALALIAAAGCGSAAPPVIANTGGADESPPRACWLPGACDLAADLDGDARTDQIELVRDGAREGLRITLATGDELLVGAGRAIDPMPGADPELEPIALESDLGDLVRVRVRAGSAPCPAQALELSGGDAAVQLCVIGAAPRAFHLGF